MSASTGLRKMSIQRLLESEERLAWTPEELDAWRLAGGWITNQTRQQYPRLAISIRALGQILELSKWRRYLVAHRMTTC
jgi:hypothetical protein